MSRWLFTKKRSIQEWVLQLRSMLKLCHALCLAFGSQPNTREKSLFWLFGGGDRLGLRCQIIYL